MNIKPLLKTKAKRDRREVLRPPRLGDPRSSPYDRRNHFGVLRIIWMPISALFTRRVIFP